ncbi:MAG: DUF1848 domain-containing protein, partial [Defluviitaleaceae bacterium]|nr:DUF1848 domain-containing protein [Defluviitaleaceae bacterium]
MIISASRRTDIPWFYSDWFFNRVGEGFVSVRNPMNFSQTRRVSLSPENVGGIVFWTKNPGPMLARLEELRNYRFYFQYTLTPYGTEIEPRASELRTAAETFRRLGDALGPDRVVWRYDPILINVKYSVEYHLNVFGELARKLRDSTKTVTVSFIETGYRNAKANKAKLNLTEISMGEKIEMLRKLAITAANRGIELNSCAPGEELDAAGIKKARCVDGELFGIPHKKAKGQRPGCGCAESVDVGAYNSCTGGCAYCYANY